MTADMTADMTAQGKNGVLYDVQAIVGSTIKISTGQLDIDAELAELGIDSIIAMELMEALSRHFGIVFTPAQFIHVNTVRELAGYIENNFEIKPAQPSPEVPPQPIVQAQEDEAPLRDLIDAVQRKYAIDLSGKNWRSVDELVDELVSNHLDPVMHGLGVDELVGQGEHATEIRAPRCEVAIVGISCRFPDAPSPDAFWQNLLDRRSSIREIPASRWDAQSRYAPLAAFGKTVSKWGALIDEIDCFDPHFFGIDPKEAQLIDPQERLLMQEVYKAIQDAGMDAKKLAGSDTGVFVGYEYAEYEQYLRKNMHQIPGLVCSSSSPTYYLANRLSYLFDFRGPSESVNVNCASSAVAINRAFLSLVHGESELAVVGSACLHLFADDYVTSSQYGLLSPNGTCAVFDNDANGFTRGEGVGAVLLKRLDSAIADNDRIYAVIKSCHQNNRGSGKTLSDVKHEAITEVISRCYEKASLRPESIDYIELNGYSKKWADSFEFEGIRNAFDATGATGATGKRCALGSLKGNIGHLEPVNGLASVIKVALSLHHKKFPATITRRATSTFIDLDNPSHPLYFADAEIAFDDIRRDAESPIRAGVSSFADSGVNVHIALEEFLPAAPRRAAAHPVGQQLFVLSAKDRARLADYVDAYLVFLETVPQTAAFADLIHAAQVGREAMDVRLAIVASSFDELRTKLRRVRETGIDGISRLAGEGIFCADIQRAEKSSLIGLVPQDMTRQQLELGVHAQQWQQMALLWTHGVEIPWEMAWVGKTVHHISLPSYPFAKDRCWMDLEGAAAPPAVPPRMAGVAVAQAAAHTKPAASSARQDRWRFHSDAGSPVEKGLAMEPAAKLELFLCQEIAQLLHRGVHEIDVDLNFVALGMGSLDIAELVTRTSHLMRINLAPSVVFKYPLVRGLARHLVQSYPDKAAALAVTEPAATAQTLLCDPDVLVPMQAAGTRSPLFLVPGADGSVLSLKLLCDALGDQQPLYGLESVGLDGNATLPGSVEEIARLNIHALRTIQPHGPYRLLGYSNGGIVAFEMVRALTEQGEEIESLLLLDTLCPEDRKSTPIELAVEVFNHLVGTLGGTPSLEARQLAPVAPHARAEYLYQWLADHRLQVDKDYFLATYQVATASEALCRAYTLRPLTREIAVSLFRAVQGDQDVPADYGWNRFLRQPVRVHDVEANHFTIIENGAVMGVAEAINAMAAEVGEKPTGPARPHGRRSRQGARSKQPSDMPVATP